MAKTVFRPQEIVPLSSAFVLSTPGSSQAAQEVEEAAQSLGYEFSGVDAPKNADDLYGLRYAEFVVPLVKAVQELYTTNEALVKRIAALESQVEILTKEVK